MTPMISGTYHAHWPDAGVHGELRLDVDGPTPLMTASGALRTTFAEELHWAAWPLEVIGDQRWSGPVQVVGPAGHRLERVELRLVEGRSQREVELTLHRRGGFEVQRYVHASEHFDTVDFEYDFVEGLDPVLKIGTHDHPNRPPSLPKEELTLSDVFERAGFAVTISSDGGPVPKALAGANKAWSDGELHDAMQTYWARVADRPQWALWVMFAGLHDEGRGLGGVMFDDIGPNQRQGTAIFLESFINDAPAGEAHPEAYIRRTKFWTAAHEIGHAFNLAHSWQKDVEGPGPGWIPLRSEPQARSFMNYPEAVAGGEAAFFRDFEYRFSRDELLFLRHAPRSYVQMGDALWFDHHGFTSVLPTPGLELRLHAGHERLEFLEPVVLDVELRNTSKDPIEVPADLLRQAERLCVIIRRRGGPARRHWPFARRCHAEQTVMLGPGESLFESLFVSAGRGGFDLCEPGRYAISAALALPGGRAAVSPALHLQIAPPHHRSEEVLAQDFFSDDVARVLAFDGSAVMSSANDVLREVAERYGKLRVGLHARVALALPQAQAWQTLDLDKHRVVAQRPDLAYARSHLRAALLERAADAVRSLSTTDFRRYGKRLKEVLAQDLKASAAPAAAELARALREYGIADRTVKEVP